MPSGKKSVSNLLRFLRYAMEVISKCYIRFYISVYSTYTLYGIYIYIYIYKDYLRPSMNISYSFETRKKKE